MKNRGFKWALLILALFAGDALAQAINGGSVSGNAGTNVVLPINVVAGGGLAGFTVDISTSSFTSASCAVTGLGGAFDTCTEVSTDVWRLNVLDTSPLGGGVAANLTLGIPGGASGSINVPLTSAGPCSDSVGGTITCSISDGTVNITVAEPEYSSSPLNGGIIQMGPVLQGGSDAGLLVVNNTGDADLIISNVSISGDTEGLFSVDPTDTSFTVTPAGSRNVDFSCDTQPDTAPATYSAQVTVNTNDSSEPTVNYSLECSVTAQPTGVNVTLVVPAGDPDCGLGACNFPDTEAGMASAAKTMTMTNTDGTDSATGFTIGTSSANFSQTNDCGGSLGPSQSCSIDVTFTPVSEGQKSGSVTVSGGNLLSGESIILNGTGLPGGGGGDDDDDDDDGPALITEAVSGSWFNPRQRGHGFLIEGVDTGAAKAIDLLVVYWFVFAPTDGSDEGNIGQQWLAGAGPVPTGATSVTIPMNIVTSDDPSAFPTGPQAGDFTSPELPLPVWGDLVFEFLYSAADDDCLEGNVQWLPAGDFLADYGSDNMDIVRITKVASTPNCEPAPAQ